MAGILLNLSKEFNDDDATFSDIVGRFPRQPHNVGCCLSKDRFVSAFLDEKGGVILFSDDSVKMDVPPRALDEPTVVYCHRSVPLAHRPTNYVHYSIPLRCGPEDAKLHRPFQLTFKHFAKIEDPAQVNNLRVLTKRHQDDQFQIDEAAQIDIDGVWAKVRIQHPCDLVVGSMLNYI